MSTYLVTGGAGFVGSHLALRLKAAEPTARVVALDNLYRAGSERNLPRLAAAGIDFVRGDVRRPADLAAVGAVDWLLECSAEPSVLAGRGDDLDYLVQTNLNGAVNCADCCRRHGAGLLFLSTSRVYPIEPLVHANYRETADRLDLVDEQALPGLSAAGVAEDFPLAGSRSLYGATKYAAETMLEEFRTTFGIPVIVNRCGVLAGPWQFGKIDQGIAAFWVQAHLEGRPLKYIGFGGTGKQVRDLLHVDDLFALVRRQLAAPDDFSGRVFNVGGGFANSVSLCQLTGIVEEVTGCRTMIGSDPETRYADIPSYISDCRRLEAHCGWRPERTVRDIVEDIAAWLRG